MKIQKIRFQNINSLRGNFELDFTAPPFTHSGLFAVTGDTGAGKTSILDALTLALFGKTARTHEKEVRSFGTDEALAEVEFSAAQGIFRVKWAQNKTEKTPRREISKQRADGGFEFLSTKSRELEGTKTGEKGLVEKITGLNFEQFRRSVMLAQGDFAAFLNADEKERSMLLERLTDTEIYTRLSKAAHEKHKAEDAQLDLFLERKKVLKILDAEEVMALKMRQWELEKSSENLSADLENQRKILIRLEKIEVLKIRLAELEIQKNQVRDEQIEFQPELQKLERHRETVPFAAQISRLNELAAEQTDLEKSVGELAENQAILEAEQNDVDKIFSEKNTAKTAAEIANRDLEKVLEMVVRLDEQLAAQRISVEKSAGEILIFQQKKSGWLAETSGFEKQISETSAALILIENWLNEHPAARQLERDIPLIDKHLETLRGFLKEKNGLQKHLPERQKQREELDIFRKNLAEKSATAESNWTAGKQILAKLLTDFELPDDESAAENELDRATEKLVGELQSLDDFARHSEQYREALSELDKVKNEQQTLQSEEFFVQKELLNSLDLLFELEEKNQVKRARFEREQAAVNYERDRQNLPDGDPCPLCGSTEHPFRLHGAGIFVDDARQEFVAVQESLEAVRLRQAKLAGRQQEIQHRLGEVKYEFDELIFQQTENLVARASAAEEKISRLLPDLPNDVQFVGNGNDLHAKIHDLKTEAERLRSAREKVQRQSRQVRDDEKTWLNCRHELQNLETRLEILTSEIGQAVEKLESVETEFVGEATSLNLILEKYGLVFQPESILQNLDVLKKQQFSWVEKLETQVDFSRKIDFWKKDLANLESQMAAADLEFFEKEKQTATARAVLENLQTTRFEIFGEKNTDDERSRSREVLENLKIEVENLRQRKNELAEKLAAVRTGLAAGQKNLTQTVERQAVLRGEVGKKLAKSGFENVDELLAASLPAAEAEAISTNFEVLKKRETEIFQSEKDANDSLKIELKNGLPDENREVFTQKIQVLESELAAGQQEIGGLKNQISENDGRKKEAAELFKKIDLQKRELQRWAKMKDLIGSHDGSAFRKFAQSLTLEQLVFFANQHLQQLNGRYLIRRQAEKELELEIIDTFQAENVRSTNTLSGGESFLVSLALALGLSDLAGRKTQVQSLFIDEGFGALDENALELAITTLENLQSRGAMIGIISHIRELKERIGVQVSVKKGADGFSEMVVLG